jgi:methyl-accepting chemotaxis protein
VLIFQMPVERINDIMTSGRRWREVGLGESGESYIVGDDLRLRSQSRFLIEDREGYLEMMGSIGMSPSTIDAIARLDSTIGLQQVETGSFTTIAVYRFFRPTVLSKYRTCTGY